MVYQTDDFVDIEPLGYEAISNGYSIAPPEKKYIVLTEPSGEWTLPGSTKLEDQPVNAWEYKGGTEIKKDQGMLFAGYLVFFGTLLGLFFMLKK